MRRRHRLPLEGRQINFYLCKILSIIIFLKFSSEVFFLISISLMAPSPTKYRKSGFSDVAALRINFATSIGSRPASTLGPNAAILFYVNSAYGELFLLSAVTTTFFPVLKLLATLVFI